MRKKVIWLFVICFAAGLQAQQSAPLFEQSYELVNGMLDGSQPYHFKQAVFSVENASLDGKLDTLAANDQIRLLTTLAKSLVKDRFLYYPEKDKETVNKWASVFQVVCDSIPITVDGKAYKYMPFSYDFADVFGHADWTHMFVSKLLATRKGNCHSLPYLYKILCEEMGVTAHLALAPNHIYIKHKSLKNGWYNTELTSGIFPIDAWIMASGFVHIDAITNGVYMKALDDRESLALVLIDLAQGYENKFPDNDGRFILKCCDAALRVYPMFATALILKAETHKAMMLKESDPAKAKIEKAALENEYAYIHQIGYRNMPENMYLNWLTSLQAERGKFENKKLNTFNRH